MIYVRIELWPGGVKAAARLLHEAVLWNDGTGSRSIGNYLCRLSKRGGFHGDPSAPSALKNVWKNGRVEGFARLRDGAWALLWMAVASALVNEPTKMAPGYTMRQREQQPE